MIQIQNCRHCLLLLPLSKVALKPDGLTSVLQMTEEIQKAVDAGWVKIVEIPTVDSANGEPAPVDLPTGNTDAATGQIPQEALATSASDEERASRESAAANSNGQRPTPHDWVIDYSEVETGIVTISDRLTGKTFPAEIVERKGEQYFTLKNLGTVKGQQFWASAQALERFNATD